MSSYHLVPTHARAYLEAMRSRRVAQIRGYASSLHSLARFVLDQGLQAEVPKLRAVFTFAEPLYDYQRETIGRAFGCRVVQGYGMVENVASASECDHGRLHLWPEVGVVEVLKDKSDEPAEPGEVGRLICTGLINDDMPLVRYELGDRGALAKDQGMCPCGRALTILESVEGRLDDVIVLRDGRRVGRLHRTFNIELPIREAQIVQEELDLIRVFVVPTDGYSSKASRLIEERLHDRVGEAVSVRVETVPTIPRGPSGKFRGVINHVLGHRDITS